MPIRNKAIVDLKKGKVVRHTRCVHVPIAWIVGFFSNALHNLRIANAPRLLLGVPPWLVNPLDLHCSSGLRDVLAANMCLVAVHAPLETQNAQ